MITGGIYKTTQYYIIRCVNSLTVYPYLALLFISNTPFFIIITSGKYVLTVCSYRVSTLLRSEPRVREYSPFFREKVPPEKVLFFFLTPTLHPLLHGLVSSVFS